MVSMGKMLRSAKRTKQRIVHKKNKENVKNEAFPLFWQMPPYVPEHSIHSFHHAVHNSEL